MMLILIILTIFCALQAVQSPRLLDATLWLAGVSALVAVVLYATGAWTIAVIELSVGAGLVTVLMVFAITMVGETREALVLSRRLWLLFAGVVTLILMIFTAPALQTLQTDAPAANETLAAVLWQARGLDVIVQIVLIFAGVLGVLGLLSASEEISSVRQDDAAQQTANDLQPEPNITLQKEVA